MWCQHLKITRTGRKKICQNVTPKKFGVLLPPYKKTKKSDHPQAIRGETSLFWRNLPQENNGNGIPPKTSWLLASTAKGPHRVSSRPQFRTNVGGHLKLIKSKSFWGFLEARNQLETDENNLCRWRQMTLGLLQTEFATPPERCQHRRCPVPKSLEGNMGNILTPFSDKNQHVFEFLDLNIIKSYQIHNPKGLSFTQSYPIFEPSLWHHINLAQVAPQKDPLRDNKLLASTCHDTLEVWQGTFSTTSMGAAHSLEPHTVFPRPISSVRRQPRFWTQRQSCGKSDAMSRM